METEKHPKVDVANTFEQSSKRPEMDCLKCSNCGKCYAVCKLGAISRVSNYDCSRCVKYCTAMDVPCKPTRFMFDFQLCNRCGDCVLICPEGAIHWLNEKTPV